MSDIAKAVPFGQGSEASMGAAGPMMARLKTDLTAAMKAGDDLAKSSLRMAIAAMQNAEVAGESARALTEDEQIAVLRREVKTRRESAETYQSAGRPELADKENAEADFLSQYLPQALTDDELAALVEEKVTALSADHALSMKDMGQLVRAVNEAAAGRADGARVAALVKARLS
ncbi:MAG: GatB/YqeY domain-containing protein [Propionibacteriaceae bacterium]|nr:GatB/YqeY domain-containing protein [Propionibacteriaceae bacterium]